MNNTHYQMDLLKAMNQNLSSRDRMYRLVCDMTDGAFLYFDIGKNEIITVGKWDEYFPFVIHEKRDLENLYELMDEPYVIPLMELLALEKTGEKDSYLDCLTRKDKRWFQFHMRVNYDCNNTPVEKILSVINITKYKQQSEELDYYSYYDVITGLYNRNYFVRLLANDLQKAEELGEVVSTLMIDIDDFHKINDGLGMIYGDELIQLFGSFLRELCNENVIACHLNSDVYCMAIFGPKDEYSVQKIYEKLSDRLKHPFILSGKQEVYISVTVGVAEYPESAQSPLDLINCSEIVMLKGKESGKNTLTYFDAPILQEFMSGLEMESKLKNALSNQKFELYYQPQYYAGNQKLRGVEALIRMHDSDNKLISPNLFVPVAEKNGSIISIGNWVVEDAIAQYHQWQLLFGVQFVLSINVSARQFKQPDFADNLLETLQKNQVEPYYIELEMTESILIEDFDGVCEKLRKLQKKGIRISLDDFGTGFSSLSYLKKLPINTLKIDKSFIDTVLIDSTTRIITESIVDMVKSLGFESIAEGVEEEQQFKYLHAIGCDVIQGYYLGKPMSAGNIENLLRQ